MRKYDVAAMGELLIDFTQNGVTNQGNPLFEANPGGAPCNVLSMLTRLGRKTTFLGKVGNDRFGRQLAESLLEAGIGIEGLVFDTKEATTLAFVHRLENGDRDFSFYRNPGADRMFTEEELDEKLLEDAAVFHFGSLSLTDEPVRGATKRAIMVAERAALIRSFDPNLRPSLWGSLTDAREQICFGLSHCDILKLSDNEIQWITGLSDYSEGVKELRKQYDIRLICVSMGKAGSRAYYENCIVEVPAFIQKKTIDTTGAGDTFCGCIIHHVLKYGLDTLTEKDLREMLTFANAAASIVTTRKGALRVMPESRQVEEFLKIKH